MTESRQLPLPVHLSDQAVFDSFFESGNGALLTHLKSLAASGSERLIWLWGGPGSGKTHLLQAACAEAGRHGRRANHGGTRLDITHDAGLRANSRAFAHVKVPGETGLAGSDN